MIAGQVQNKHRERRAGLTIPVQVIEATRMSVDELKLEIAIMLFQREKLTLAQASELAGMSRYQFQHLLADRQISIHYTISDFKDDLETLGEL